MHAETDAQEKAFDRIGDALADLRRLGGDMQAELSRQEPTIDRVGDHAQRARDDILHVSKSAAKGFGVKEVRGELWCRGERRGGRERANKKRVAHPPSLPPHRTHHRVRGGGHVRRGGAGGGQGGGQEPGVVKEGEFVFFCWEGVSPPASFLCDTLPLLQSFWRGHPLSVARQICYKT